MIIPGWLSLTRPLAQSEPVTSALLQYGAIGITAAIALFASRMFYRQVQESHAALVLKLTEARDRERDRADRLEEELRKQNTAIQDKYVVVLGEATRVIADALRHNREDR